MTNERTAYVIANREVREIPKGWQHPRDAKNTLIPLLPFGYQIDDEIAPFEEMMPVPLGEIEIAAYETVTEGTPISPAFPDTPEGRLALINWCAEHATTFGSHRADGEAWAAILFGDAAITLDGRVVAEG